MHLPQGGEALPATIFKRQTGGGYPRLLWWPLLRGVILPIRSPRVAKLYQSVWMEEGSPLMVYSRRPGAGAGRPPAGYARCARRMSYGKPSLAAPSTLCWRRALNTLVLALYPQYSCSHGSCRLGRTGAHSGDPPPYTGYHLYPRLRR